MFQFEISRVIIVFCIQIDDDNNNIKVIKLPSNKFYFGWTTDL